MTNIKNYNCKISDIFQRENVPKGEVGIEIEVEGVNLPTQLKAFWTIHHDGSLRGESAEYVLAVPVSRREVRQSLEYLKSHFKSSVVHDSIRTSVHVHLNMHERTMLEIYVILIVYFILENLIIELAGANRVGNLFCLRIKDAEYLLDQLVRAAQKDNFDVFTEEQRLRYAAVNICALFKFNSLEFRAMRGTNDPETISEWVELLLAIVDNSTKNYKTPLEVIQDFSAIGSEEFAFKILGRHLTKFAGHDINKILWGSVRKVQELAYCTDWTFTDYKPVKKLFGQRLRPVAPPLAPRVVAPRLRNPFVVNTNTPAPPQPVTPNTTLQPPPLPEQTWFIRTPPPISERPLQPRMTEEQARTILRQLQEEEDEPMNGLRLEDGS